jgi:hypothetical protein
MKNRFDLEQEICQVANFSNHLRNINTSILEHELSQDEIVNALEGLAVLIQSYENVLFDTFTQVLKLDKYNEN